MADIPVWLVSYHGVAGISHIPGWNHTCVVGIIRMWMVSYLGGWYHTCVASIIHEWLVIYLCGGYHTYVAPWHHSDEPPEGASTVASKR